MQGVVDKSVELHTVRVRQHKEGTMNADSFLDEWDDLPLANRDDLPLAHREDETAGAGLGTIRGGQRQLNAAHVPARSAPIPTPFVGAGIPGRHLGHQPMAAGRQQHELPRPSVMPVATSYAATGNGNQVVHGAQIGRQGTTSTPQPAGANHTPRAPHYCRYFAAGFCRFTSGECKLGMHDAAGAEEERRAWLRVKELPSVGTWTNGGLSGVREVPLRGVSPVLVITGANA